MMGRLVQTGRAARAAWLAALLLMVGVPQGLAQLPGCNPAPPITITRPPFSQQLTPGFGPLNVCPQGYVASVTAIQNVHLVICKVLEGDFNRCGANPATYECGADGNECCPAAADNPCFPGAYACSDPALGPAAGHHLCCMTR